ncbi:MULTISPECIES: 5-(carboxyamino)imidazole ribonucleotide mutase [Methanosarcina]|jgi:5-(carboxyamino)imidazole ribonucleotide mutase|uniref:5-(Carboxyamino)imidazole ribonucleotide mutase n=8 Tax=Methanosarcina mazei TaxID=2209 RepID=A0A0F8P7M9_METMZ|nr:MULTISPECIES: AIR carboxylase family protein [Methanosarcina]AAM32056.1 Phosphoribosylaminoimidazole carboxylase, catalytic subunit [Methanosarcina mazei Go1]AGF97721.1 Phosphoribosylaminoimidazole carboxylase catalytic subunit [Methanosarcina mazei Tuc01]AKB41019.1 Phosphoribosylaminoimidazole carboxylase catalytic subunit [Methanosarcina mazei WWM610]AKB62200.1 Phosphoribosylaminoimidazole carboxylase catalytic subunit [Methanosarcina mazei SarPi]AKB65535.1 Phosphoribosylaminoimidazole ca
MVDISLIMGSESDRAIANRAVSVIEKTRYTYEVMVISAHRNPDELDIYISNTDAKVFITIAGLSAALPGVVASKTKKPVIGVPVSAKLGGLDALLSIAQMPPGVPVGSVGIDNGANGAYLALRILDLIENP